MVSKFFFTFHLQYNFVFYIFRSINTPYYELCTILNPFKVLSTAIPKPHSGKKAQLQKQVQNTNGSGGKM